MKNTKIPLISAAILSLALAAPAWAKPDNGGTADSPPPVITQYPDDFIGPLPPNACRTSECAKTQPAPKAGDTKAGNCTQSSCPWSPPADTTLDKLDPCNPPKIPCANYDPAKNLPENKDGWTKTANGYISNSCTDMECVAQNCASSPNIAPCAAEKKAKEDASKAESTKLLQAAEKWAKDHANLNGNKTASTPGPFGATSVSDIPPGGGAAADNQSGGVAGAPATNPDQNSVEQANKEANLIADANGLDAGIPPETNPGNYGAVSGAARGLEGGGGGKAAGEAFNVKNQAKDLTSQTNQTGGGGGFFSKLWAMASSPFDGISTFRASASSSEDTMVHRPEAMEARKPPPNQP